VLLRQTDRHLTDINGILDAGSKSSAADLDSAVVLKSVWRSSSTSSSQAFSAYFD
jgi:hypothetical protein